MPRHPMLRPSEVPVSYVGQLRERAARQREVFELWLGDSCYGPPEDATLPKLELTGPELYRYGAPRGDRALLDALAGKLASHGITASPGDIVITSGASHALDCAIRTVIEPDDEVLLLAPYWPLLRGQVLAAGARPIEVAFSSQLLLDPSCDPAALVERAITPRTAAVYFASPNNPDGKVLGPRELAAIRDVAVRHDLWIIADEVYEDMVFDGAHASIAALDGAASRTFTVFSFSKSYAMPGLRVGYVVAPPTVSARTSALAMHSVFNVPLFAQRAALAALDHGREYLEQCRESARAARDLVARKLAAYGARPPEGAIYYFLHLGAFVRPGRSVLDLLGTLADEGVLLAHGAAFGGMYHDHARLCFCAIPSPRLEAGLERLSSVLERERA